jgi:hypothetical protein
MSTHVTKSHFNLKSTNLVFENHGTDLRPLLLQLAQLSGVNKISRECINFEDTENLF